MQIRIKLTLIYLSITGAILFVSFGLIYYFSLKREHEDFRYQLLRKARTSADLLLKVNEVDSSLLKIIDMNKSDLLISENISIYNKDGKELYTNNDSIHFNEMASDFDEIRNGVLNSSRYFGTIGKLDVVGMVYPFKGQSYVIMAGAEDVQGNRYLDRLWKTLFFVLVSVLCISGYVGWWYAGRALSPMNEIIANLERIKATDLKKRLLGTGSGDEIDRLVRSLNDTLERLQRSFEDQRSFVSFASHELNNPIASLTTQIEVALLRSRGTEEYEKILKRLQQELERIKEVISHLLTLSGITSGTEQSAIIPFRIDERVFATIQRLQKKHPENSIIVDAKMPEDEEKLIVLFNPVLFESALGNLIDNACKYSSTGEVRVELHFSDDIQIEVSNPANDINDELIRTWFQPYIRGKHESKKGTGLGLTIVERIGQAIGFGLTYGVKGNWVYFNMSIRPKA
jgi:signal transduction histidine kinase